MTVQQTQVNRVRRVARPASVATAQATPTAAPRTIRAARSTQGMAQLAVDKEIADQLQLIATAHVAIDAAVQVQQEAEAKIEALMRKHNREGHIAHGYKATLTEAFSRTQTTIDPKQFRARAGDTNFWKAVKVGMQEAKEVLGDREIHEISKTVPAKSLGLKLKIDAVKVKAERK